MKARRVIVTASPSFGRKSSFQSLLCPYDAEKATNRAIDGLFLVLLLLVLPRRYSSG